MISARVAATVCVFVYWCAWANTVLMTLILLLRALIAVANRPNVRQPIDGYPTLSAAIRTEVIRLALGLVGVFALRGFVVPH